MIVKRIELSTRRHVSRKLASQRYQFEVEKELALRLKNADPVARRGLYRQVYEELVRQVPDFVLAARSRDLQAQARAVIPQVRLLKPFVRSDMTFLEIGAGDGALACAMAGLVRRVCAIEVTDIMTRGRVWPSNVDFHLFDGVNLPVEPGCIHLAYSHDVIEHVHPDDALDQMRSVCAALAPGGVYLCVTPNRLSGPWDVSRHFTREASGLHLREYSLTELEDLYRQSGFSRVEAILSFHGFRLSPHFRTVPVRWLEKALEHGPTRLVRKLAEALTAIKFIGWK